MTRAVLSIGSNLGDRLAHLQGAVDELASIGVDVIAVSPVYETAPVGGPEQEDFLNAVVIVRTALGPYELLEACQGIEAAHERVRDVRWGPRTLDVDIIVIDGVASDDPLLTLPHPRVHERAFVCVPWLDVDPTATLPHGAIAHLPLDRSGIVRRDDLALAMPSSERP